jgi:hypothetical protein
MRIKPLPRSFTFILTLTLGAGPLFVAWAQASLLGEGGSSEMQAETGCLRYNEIQQRFIHNAFSAPLSQKDEQLLDQLIYHRIRAIELDLMPKGVPCGSAGPPPGEPDWFIYHDCSTIAYDMTTVQTLSEALRLLRAFHDAQPQHEVVTIDLELGSNKDLKGIRSEWDPYTPEQLDDLIRRHLGEALFTPESLLTWGGEKTDATGSLHRVVSTRGWPTTDEIRGKFIFIGHGGEKGDLEKYFDLASGLSTVHKRVLFLLDESDWKDPQFIADPFSWKIFHSEASPAEIAHLRRNLPGHILRSTETDDPARVREFQAAGAHFLFTNSMDADEHPFIRFHNGNLYPFAASVPKPNGTFPVGDEALVHPSVDNKIEPGSIFVVGDKSGGDMDDHSDDFTFAHNTGSGLPETWTVEIASASNRRFHPHGKGFLMARASLASDAPYFAVGRTADRFGLRIQYRTAPGGDTGFAELSVADQRDIENRHFVKLEITPHNGGTRCGGFGSIDGRSWRQIGPEIDLEGVKLSEVGLAVSSNSGLFVSGPPGNPTKIFFVNLQRSVNGQGPFQAPPETFFLDPVGRGFPEGERRIFQPAVRCLPIAASNDPGKCGATVDLFRAISGHCGALAFSTEASISIEPRSFFPVGTTMVTATTVFGGATCTFPVTVLDSEKPQITCPPNRCAFTTRAGDPSVPVNYAPPVAADNCGSTSVVCTPPSGSIFPVGVTTVNCAATDTAGNTAACAFTVTVMDFCIVDDVAGTVLKFSSATREYVFVDRRKGITLKGVGTITRAFCKVTLTDLGPNPKVPDRNISVTANTCTQVGTASVSFGATSYRLNDSNMSGNGCTCP